MTPVYFQYDQQSAPQNAYLEITWKEDGEAEVTADYTSEIGGGIPSDVWHNQVTRLSIMPGSTGASIQALLESEDFIKRVDKLNADYECTWDNSNWIGSNKTGDRETWNDEINCLEYYAQENIETVDVWTIEDWLQNSMTIEEESVTITMYDKEYIITASTTDDELKPMREDLETLQDEGVSIIGDVGDYLESLRDDLAA